MKKSNVTYINDLIDLDSVPSSIEPEFNRGSSDFNNKMKQENYERETMVGPIKNKIRKNTDFNYAMNGGNELQKSNYNYQTNEGSFDYALGPRAQGHLQNTRQYQQQQQEFMPFLQENFSSLSCIDIANHQMSCPVCSKLYNNDKTSYIIAIVLLVVICIILLKKVLDKD